MKKIDLLNNGIPVSPSLNPTLEAENFRPRRSHNRNRVIALSCIVFIVAVFVSVLAKLLMYLIALITNISFYATFSFSESSPSASLLGPFVIFVPAIGGVIVGLMALYGSDAIRGHGIPEAMEQILTNQSKIKPVITFLKPLSSAIAIGTGGPFGAEGPIIATGGAFGSGIGQILSISDYERKILLTAGATAGMAAIFGTPLAAMFLAIELLLFEFSPRSLIPVAIACMVGAAGHHLLFGSKAVFEMKEIVTVDIGSLVACGMIGILTGLLSVFASKAIYWIEEGFDKIHIHWMWWPALGGLVVGIVGYFYPRTLGVGYNNITEVLSGTLPVKVVVSLLVFKFISWSVALGSGTSGGTLAPLLTIGGAAGILLAMVINFLFPWAAIALPVAALVGMAAMFAGASRALLTSIVFAVETTSSPNALLPLLVTCLASYLVSLFLMEQTIMTEKIARRGIRTPHSYESDLLTRMNVDEVMRRNNVLISEDCSVKEVYEWLHSKNQLQSQYFIVSNKEGEYRGIISSLDVLSQWKHRYKKISELPNNHHTPILSNFTLRHTVERMAKENIDALPVLSKDDLTMIGIISYRDILTVYKYGVDEHERKKPNIAIKKDRLKLLVKGQKLVQLTRRKVSRFQNVSDQGQAGQ